MSITAAIAAMALPLAERRLGPLERRVIAALVLGPAVLLCVHAGGAWLGILVVATVAVAGWEWASLCDAGRFRGASWLLAGGVVASAALAAVGEYRLALAACLATLVAVAVAGRRMDHPLWLAGGSLYVALPAVALLWLRQEPAAGRDLLIWVFLVVWAADSGAYAVGRTIGGPRLAPRISPNKTWSGLVGGLAAATGTGALAAAAFGAGELAVAAASGTVVGAATMLGDLVESAAKRRFQVKDTSRLIPGHGGLLDRIDGLLLAAPTALALWFAGWRWV